MLEREAMTKIQNLHEEEATKMFQTNRRLVSVVEDNGEKYVSFQDAKLPLYEMNGVYYFLDSIPVDFLARDEEAQPRPYNENQARKIANSIKKKILMQPLLTRYDPESGTFLITEGQHRWRAMKDILGEERVPCIVYLEMSKHVALLCGLEANAEDRARALSGGDVARKTHALMEEYRILLEKEAPDHEVTEQRILERMGQTTRAQQKKFLLGKIIEDVVESRAKIGEYTSDRQSADKPVTAKNFAFFLTHLVRTTPLSEIDTDLRDDEFANVIQLTDILAKTLFENGKWDPDNPSSHTHRHAANICRRHPLEACGYFLGKLVDRHGGGEVTIGACYAPTDRIDWPRVEEKAAAMLLDDIWDQDHVRFCRNMDDLKGYLSQALEL